MSIKKREISELEMDLKNFLCCCSNLSVNDGINSLRAMSENESEK